MLPMFSLVWIMPPRVMTRSAGRPAAASRGGGTSGPASKGGGGQGSEVNDGVNRVPDFSTIIAQQLQNLLPTIVAQVGDQGRGQGNGRNQNGDAVNDTFPRLLKYTAGSFIGKALTWWNSQIRTLGQVVAVGMSWDNFKAWPAEYTDRFHELARLVPL
ncbi:hypothetical protein Tco_0803758 [Tanacetum coccineum]|uniref:Reverse transcriptase domain-containing protein n=1 Tax=Tanacetum coccineum TaxID=301880 RepID=A0ABQ5A6S3_9ASTR